MNTLLNSCIFQLREMLASGGMTLADRRRLHQVIEDLEALRTALACERDDSKRRALIAQCVELVARVLAKVFFDTD